MKIAVCFTGYLRTAEYAVDNLLHFFGDLNGNIDFYIHTWIDNQYKNYYIDSSKIDKIFQENNYDKSKFKNYPEIMVPPYEPKSTFEILDNIKSKYKINAILIENQNKIKLRDPITYSWKKVLALQQHKDYDIVVRTRPDVLFPLTNSLQKEIDKLLSFKNKNIITSIRDVFFITFKQTSDELYKFFLAHPEIGYNQLGVNLNKMKNIKMIKQHNFHSIYRPDAIPISSLDYKKCYAIDVDYYWTKRLSNIAPG